MANYTLPENWDSFPVKNAVMGGVKKRIKLDEENNIIYLLDENGNWTGEKCVAPPKKPAGNGDEESQDAATTEASAQDTGEKKPEKKKKKPKKSSGATPLLIIIICILGGILLWQNFGNTKPEAKRYPVIVAMENIYPGDVVSEKLASTTISEEDYARYKAEGGLYHPDEYSEIKKYVATEFIPKDGCITYANVGEVFNIKNPWTMTGCHVIVLPVSVTTDDLEEFIWGNRINLQIRVEHTIEHFDEYPGHRPSADGIEGYSELKHRQIDYYSLKGYTIVDVFNNKMKSLYSSYAGVAAIPDNYLEVCLPVRYKSEDEIKDDMPAYIAIEVSEEVLEWWEDANHAYHGETEVSVSWMKVIGSGCENELQSKTHFRIKGILEKLVDAMENTNFDKEVS